MFIFCFDLTSFGVSAVGSCDSICCCWQFLAHLSPKFSTFFPQFLALFYFVGSADAVKCFVACQRFFAVLPQKPKMLAKSFVSVCVCVCVWQLQFWIFIAKCSDCKGGTPSFRGVGVSQSGAKTSSHTAPNSAT